MRRLTPLTSLLLLFAASVCTMCAFSCASGAQGGSGITWPKVAHCVPTASDLMGTVQRVLLGDGDNTQTTISDRAKSELTDLAVNHGSQAIACLIDQVIQDWTRPGAAASDERVAATARGRSFLNQVGTQIERDSDPPQP